MANQSPVAIKLKKLRERSGVSVRSLADFAGMKTSSYSHYEDAFKGDYLPVWLVKRVGPLLAGRGSPPIDLAEVEALAGIGAADSLESELISIARQLDPGRVATLIQVGRSMLAAADQEMAGPERRPFRSSRK